MEDESRTVKITELKAQIDGARYDIDTDAVARAFVSRMIAAHSALRRADVCALLSVRTVEEIRLTA